MVWFLLGFELVFAAVFAAGLPDQTLAGRFQSLLVSGLEPTPLPQLAALLLLLPAATAVLTADLLNRMSPRRLFDPRLHRPIAQCARGLVTAVATCGIALISLVYVREGPHDGWVLVGSSAFCTAISILSLSRVRTGRCVDCGYDLRAKTEAPALPQCPECGRFHTAG